MIYFRIASTIAGALLLLLALRNAWRGRISRRWPKTMGRITKSFVLVGDDGNGAGSYLPQVEYEYAVAGTEYRGELLQQGRIGSWNRTRAERVIAPYPAGAGVAVFFDPRRPATATLLPGSSWGNLAIALAGLVFMLCAVMLGIAGTAAPWYRQQHFMLWFFDEIWTRLGTPEPLSVAALPIGVILLLAASGVLSEAKFGAFSLPLPKEKRHTKAWRIAGVSLILFSIVFSLLRSPYKPSIDSKLIYTGPDARQIVADGEDLFLLTQSGSVFRISGKGPELEYDGTGTRQIASAGGVLYILKNNGNVWLRASIFGKKFDISDQGTGTKQIVLAGETLYVLKANGNIWKSITVDPEPARFIQIDDGTNTKMMSSAGAALYILKNSGAIFQYLPVQQGSFQEILDSGGGRMDADAIDADGGTLYLIRRNGTTWSYKDGSSSIIESAKTARKIDALSGVLYILTNERRIIRYASPRDREELADAGDDNSDIAAYGRDLFAIKKKGSVWKYSEITVKR